MWCAYTESNHHSSVAAIHIVDIRQQHSDNTGRTHWVLSLWGDEPSSKTHTYSMATTGPFGTFWIEFKWQCCLNQGSLSSVSMHNNVSLEAARFVFTLLRSLWNLTGTSATMLPRCPSNSKDMRRFELATSRLRGFTKSHDKTSYRILKRGHECCWCFTSTMLSQWMTKGVFVV